jgi:hypothetical protein
LRSLGAILVASCRARIAASLRWFTSRAGLCVLTTLVSLALLGYVYSSLGADWAFRNPAPPPPQSPPNGFFPSGGCVSGSRSADCTAGG